MSKENRSRVWTFILYPTDSAPSEWQKILDDEKVQWCESPLHDKDINADETQKKIHKHILLKFSSLKSYNQVLEITKKVNGTIPQKCANTTGMIRYFAHLDNPEKAQYSMNDIIGHCGFDVFEYLSLSSSDKRNILREIMQCIIDNDITEYCDLVELAFYKNEQWFDLISNGYSIFLTNYIKSKNYKRQNILKGQ